MDCHFDRAVNCNLSFQTIAQHEKYIREFLHIMDEEHLPYTAGAFTDRKLPRIILPPAEA